MVVLGNKNKININKKEIAYFMIKIRRENSDHTTLELGKSSKLKLIIEIVILFNTTYYLEE